MLGVDSKRKLVDTSAINADARRVGRVRIPEVPLGYGGMARERGSHSVQVVKKAGQGR